MSELDPRIVRGELIIKKATQAILDKEELTSAEVKWYLSQDLMARTIFAEVRGSPSPLDFILQEALGEWNSNRAGALMHILYLTKVSQERGMDEMAETCARCAITLMQEPLIPDIDLGRNREMLDLAISALQSDEKQPKLGPIFNAHASGVFYNVARFCPQILLEVISDSDAITDEDVKNFQHAFLVHLEALQKRSLPRGGM